MKRGIHFFLTIYLLLACVDLLASRADTTAKVRYKTPRSSLLYLVYWAHPIRQLFPIKQLYVLGEVEFEDSGFRFVGYKEIPGWPESEFQKFYPLNKGFR